MPGVCGVVPGSVLPGYTGIEAGLSAVGDIFDGIARRAGSSVARSREGLEHYRAGQTGLLRLVWDNGDRTVLVNPKLGGVTLGWNLCTPRRTSSSPPSKAPRFTPASSSSACRRRLARQSHHQRRRHPAGNHVLNQVYANALSKPVLVPAGDVTSLGSAIFAFRRQRRLRNSRRGAGRALSSVQNISAGGAISSDVR